MNHDLRYVVRLLWASPKFTLMTVVTLAIGIGAATSGFTLATWLVLTPLPGVRDGGRIAVIWFGERGGSGFLRTYPVTPSQLPPISRGAPALRGLAGRKRDVASVSASRGVRHLEIEFVMPSYFTVLGTEAGLGRLLREEDDVPPTGLPVAVIGHDLWLDLFDADPGVVGQLLRVNTQLFTVVGVAPAGFHGADRVRAVDLWLPGRAWLLLQAARGGPVPLEPAYGEFLSRIAIGATFNQAEQQLQAVSEKVLGQPPIVFRGVGVWPPIRATAEDTVRLVVAITGIVLLIACANTANLLLFRGLARHPQTAMRKLLGASLGRLMCQGLIEGLLLAVLAGTLGVLIGRWFVDAFRGLSLWRGAVPVQHLPFDWRVGMFACLVSLGSALLAQLAPSFFAARAEPMAAIRGAVSTQTRGNALRQAFAVFQVSLSLVLLVCGLLVAKTLRNLARVELGFEPSGVSAASVTPTDQAYDQPRMRAYYRELLRRVGEVPGVQSASLASSFPFGRQPFSLGNVVAASAPSSLPVTVVTIAVSPEYFRTLRIPVIAGRTFADGEFLAPSDSLRHVAVLSQGLARRMFGERNPVGQYLGPGPAVEVVGVVGNARQVGYEESSVTPWHEGEVMYIPLQGQRMGGAAILLRSGRPHREVMSTIRSIALQLDASISLHDETTLRDAIRGYLSDRVLFGRLLTLLSALAVSLAAIGLYGLVSYGVATRTREIGTRIALGASRSRVVQSVVREALLVSSAGVVLGAGPAVLVARLMKSRLYGLSAFDPATYLLGTVALTLVALAAGVIPADTAARIDPMAAMRVE